MNSIRGIWSDRHPIFLFLMMVVMMLAGSVLSAAIGILLAGLFTSISMADTFAGGTEWMENIAAMRWIQGTNNLGTFLIPGILMAHLSSEDGLAFIGARKRNTSGQAFIAVVMIIAATPLISWSVEIMDSIPRNDLLTYLDRLEKSSMDAIENFLMMEGWIDLLLNTIVMALIPALAEEFLFRGYLQPLIQKTTGKLHVAVWITALGFAILHGQFNNLLAILLIGAVLGYLRAYSNTIWLPVLAHFTNNALTLFVSYAFVQSGMDINELKNLDYGPMKIPFIAFSAIMVISAVYLIRMIGNRNSEV
jgi:hypothetical protein